jgi:AAA+ ATPase superfamily predicted ATPase
MDTYTWKPVDQFLNRRNDLALLESWWGSPTRDALALVGRRRVGKSWLFRKFAHEKPAVILVADRRLATTQMSRFADALEPHLAFRPEIPHIATLVRLLYQLGRDNKILAVIDEFPLLLAEGKARDEALSEVQAIMEDNRDESKTKLVFCGSLIGQMESLLNAGSPLHGRLQPLNVWPLTFAESKPMTEPADSPERRVVRYAVAGGMARYLDELGNGSLRDVVSMAVLDRRGPLFNDPRVVLEQELRSPATYFSILEELANHPALTEHLTNALQVSSSQLAPYLETLREMRLIETSAPVGARTGSRAHKHRVSDGFTRFWFRFVFPNQEGLQSGLRTEDLWDADIEPYLAGFVSPTYEELCVRYTRIVYGALAPNVGGWWGAALNKHRRTKSRLTEEIDVVAAQRGNLKVVGECKWTTGKMARSVLDDLRTYKIPAITEEKNLRVSAGGPDILLFSRSGFVQSLQDEAASHPKVVLVDLETLVAVLDSELTR